MEQRIALSEKASSERSRSRRSLGSCSCQERSETPPFRKELVPFCGGLCQKASYFCSIDEELILFETPALFHEARENCISQNGFLSKSKLPTVQKNIFQGTPQMKNVILYLRNHHVLWTDLQRGKISYENHRWGPSRISRPKRTVTDQTMKSNSKRNTFQRCKLRTFSWNRSLEVEPTSAVQRSGSQHSRKCLCPKIRLTQTSYSNRMMQFVCALYM